MPEFQSRPDGEYARCRSCGHAGYGVDAWHPATPEFWPTHHGKLLLNKCRACRSEVQERKFGFIPAGVAA